MRRWPHWLPPTQDIRTWIAGALPGAPEVSGPTDILRVKDWGITARFAVTRAGPSETVIFKATALPHFAPAPRFASLLTRHCPGAVADLLAWSHVGDAAWMLYDEVPGRRVRTSRRALGDTARTLARVQATVAALPAIELEMLPQVKISQLPAMFESVLSAIYTRYGRFWREDGRGLADQFGLYAGIGDEIETFRPYIAHWTRELAAGGWPLSVDHVDVQLDNVLLTPDGRTVLLDWEEANVSCPFFSIDLLLDEVRISRQDASARTAVFCTSGQQSVLDAYLDALPWKTLMERERACRLALCLSPLKHAYEAELLADALGWEEGAPHITAWAIGRALPRWKFMLSQAT